jgi:hypothetical protein
MIPPLRYVDFDGRVVGLYDCGEVRVIVCRHCERHWLVFFYEHEAFTRSGHWYRGMISSDVAATVTVENAFQIISGVPWHPFQFDGVPQG